MFLAIHCSGTLLGRLLAYTILLMLLFFYFSVILFSVIKIVFHYFIFSESNCRKILMALLLTSVLPRVIRTRGIPFLTICVAVVLTFTITIIITILKYNYNILYPRGFVYYVLMSFISIDIVNNNTLRKDSPLAGVNYYFIVAL